MVKKIFCDVCDTRIEIDDSYYEFDCYIHKGDYSNHNEGFGGIVHFCQDCFEKLKKTGSAIDG